MLPRRCFCARAARAKVPAARRSRAGAGGRSAARTDADRGSDAGQTFRKTLWKLPRNSLPFFLYSLGSLDTWTVNAWPLA
eukprot:5261523-Alexandrium_andersonii.AAC.1